MKKLLLLIAVFVTINAKAQSLSIETSAQPGGAITVTWDADFNGQPPAFLTIGIVYGRTLATASSWAGVYGWSYVNNGNVPIELQGTRTIYPPSWMSSKWALVVGNLCYKTSPDVYVCIPTVLHGPIKLK